MNSQPSSRLNGDWRVKTFELLHEAYQLRLDAEKIRAKGAATSKHRFESDRVLRSRVVEGLRHKLNQTRMQRGRLEDRLIEASKEITEAERARGDLRQSLSDKEEPFQLACGRLRMRDKRPNSEKIRDAAERALEAELGSLNESIVNLRDKKVEVADEIELLKRMKSDLEVDCNAKNKTLHLDTLCLRLQLQSTRGGAAGDMAQTHRSGMSRASGRDTARSVRSDFSEARSQYDSRPSTAASVRSDISGGSVRTASTAHTGRHRDIMRQLEKMSESGVTPRPPTGLSGLSRPTTASRPGTGMSSASGHKKAVW